jgi:hypothetical protein
VDLDALGYVQEEFFLTGEATSYRPKAGTELAFDGRWHVESLDRSAFKTRMVVIRPRDAAIFNGTVVVLWNNVSAGYENFGGGDGSEFFELGYACVAVSAQRVGVHGTGDNPQGLVDWDPERYGSLSIPSDDYSYDIFTQAARAIAPGRSLEGIDPLGGLEVERTIAQGASQSAARLATYFNAIEPLSRCFDGFFLLMYFGGGTPLEVGDAVMTVQDAGTATSRPRIPEGLHLLRSDLEIPLMVVNTECEATACYPVRQPDTERFRYWEIAGASHVSLQAMASSAPRSLRDFGFALPLDDPALKGINQVSIAPVVDAALHHLQYWIRDDRVPPVQPRIEFGVEPPDISRDADGIARGGIRLPQVEVPLAHNSAIQRAPDIFARLVGSHEAFSVDDLRRRYGSRERYLAAFEKAARSAESASVILPRDVEALVAEAQASCPL